MQHRLQEFRKAAKLGQQAVADVLGLTVSQISRMERGDADITLARLEKLAGLYGCSVPELLGYPAPGSAAEIDLNRLRDVIEEVETLLVGKRRPAPAAVAKAVVEVYRIEADLVAKHPGEQFDPTRYRGIIQAVLEG